VESEWRCKECGTLLATFTDQRVFVAHKGAQYVIDGTEVRILAICRSCTAVNEYRSGESEDGAAEPRGSIRGGRR
jgi:hypothetical protein